MKRRSQATCRASAPVAHADSATGRGYRVNCREPTPIDVSLPQPLNNSPWRRHNGDVSLWSPGAKSCFAPQPVLCLPRPESSWFCLNCQFLISPLQLDAIDCSALQEVWVGCSRAALIANDDWTPGSGPTLRLTLLRAPCTGEGVLDVSCITSETQWTIWLQVGSVLLSRKRRNFWLSLLGTSLVC